MDSFLGISIVSDLFMSAIEKITSKTKEIHIAGSDPNAPADVIEVPVWNDTVANLTLMALGIYDQFIFCHLAFVKQLLTQIC